MTVPLTVNGVTFSYPETGDDDWGSSGSLWALAVTTGMLQKAGGSFTLTADVNFGASFGLLSQYFSTRTSSPAQTGQVRLASSDAIGFRNNADSADLLLAINGSNILTFGGEVIPSGLIVNADVDAAAAIAFSKMASLSTSVAVVTDGSGIITTSATTATQIGYLSTASSDLQTQITARLQLAGGTMTGNLILNADPSISLQAATKSYVDALATGLNAKTAVRIATTTSGTLASSFENGDTIDGVTLATNDRILIKNQAAPAENGIYTVNASGAPTRATDADTWAEIVAAYVFVSAGTANTATSWVCNVAAGGTLGVTAVTFAQFSAAQAYVASGEGIVLSGNTFSLQLDGTTLSQSGSGVKVNQIANAQIAAAAAIAVNKLAAVTASRALVSDGSGFASASSVTSTTLAFLDATSSVQTQLDARILSSVMTTNGDMIYRSAGVPTRLPGDTSGYVLTMNSGRPAWTDQKTSYNRFYSSASSYSVPVSWTALPLSSMTNISVGTAITPSSNHFSPPFDGTYDIEVIFSNVSCAGPSRKFAVRLYRTSGTPATIDASIFDQRSSSNREGSSVFSLRGSIVGTGTYEVQVCADSIDLVATKTTIDSQDSRTFMVSIDRMSVITPVVE